LTNVEPYPNFTQHYQPCLPTLVVGFWTLAFRAGPFRICGGQGGTGI